MTGLLSAFPRFDLERWFADQPRDVAVDLTGSGAAPLSLAELLSVASPAEHDAFARVTLDYGPGDGSDALRGLIARRYRGVSAEEVVVTSGAIEALFLLVTALVLAGDEVVVQAPMYPAVECIARAAGARAVRWRLDAEHGFRADIGTLAPLLSRKTRLVAITQPNGPTGSVVEPSELEALVDLLSARGIRLLSDEVYRDLVLEPGLMVPAAVDTSPRAISIGDVTKPFGLGGLRIGWIVARDPELREQIVARRDLTTLSIPTPSDALARIALDHAGELLARPIADAKANLATLTTLARRDGLISLVPPRAGVTAFPRVRSATAVQRQLAAAGVLVVPGAFFGDVDRLRLWLAAPPVKFALGLARLEAALSAPEA